MTPRGSSSGRRSTAFSPHFVGRNRHTSTSGFRPARETQQFSAALPDSNDRGFALLLGQGSPGPGGPGRRHIAPPLRRGGGAQPALRPRHQATASSGRAPGLLAGLRPPGGGCHAKRIAGQNPDLPPLRAQASRARTAATAAAGVRPSEGPGTPASDLGLCTPAVRVFQRPRARGKLRVWGTL